MDRKRRMAGRYVAVILLTLAASVAVLAGCGRDGKGTAGTGQQEAGRENAGTAGNEAESPRGRYVEETIEFPFDSSEEWMGNMFITSEGELTILTRDSEDSSRLYQWNASGEWETDETLTDRIPEGSVLLDMAYAGADMYFLAKDSAGMYVGKAGNAGNKGNSENGMQTERIADSLLEKENIVNISCFLAGTDGTVLFSLMDGRTVAYNPESGRTLNLYQKVRNSSFNTSSTVIGDTYITAGDREFSVYSIKTGEELEPVPYQTGNSDVNGSLTSGGEQDLYLCNPAGIHHMTLNGTMWETVVDGTLNSLSLPGIRIKKLCAGSNNDFFVWYEADEKPYLAHYVFDPDILSVPSETLTVYGLNMEEKQLIRQGAVRFQMEKPEVRVEVLDGRKQMEGMKDADIIRALNAELLGGMGADILVLDGLPAQAYKEKGILEDMSEDLNPLIKEELYPNLVKGFSEEDGAVYEMPVRILFPIVYGKASAAKSFSGLEVFSEYQNSPDAGAVRGRTVYENILRQLSFLYYNELWDESDGKWDEDAVKLLLEAVMQTGKNCGAQSAFDAAEDGGNGEKYNQISENGFTGQGLLELAEERTVVSLELPRGMEEMSLPFSLVKDKGYGLYTVNSKFYPVERIGINKNSGKIELAKEFVRFLLSEKIQSEDVRDGFPVSYAGTAGWEKREIAMTYGTGSSEGTMLLGAYPDREERKTMISLIDELHDPVIPDNSVISILTEEAKGLFEGTQDLEATVKKTGNKVTLYQAEME